MKKVLFFIAPVFLAAIVFFGYQFFFNREIGKGALQITSVPESSVFLDNVFIGKTPLCKCEGKDTLPVGDYAIKLVPKEEFLSPFAEKITIRKSVLTVVDRTFGKGSDSSGSIISLTPLSNYQSRELAVLSIPEGVEVYLDSIKVGKTPYSSTSITSSDHELRLSKTGYNDKIVRIKITDGYKLTAAITLSVNPDAVATSSSEASASASLTPAEVQKVTILETPTGFLRVRQEASINSSEVGRVNPGESYELVEEQEGWYKIKVSSDVVGWVSAQYAKKQ